ncbi:MAG: phage tail protein [Flavobacteriales bacterium]
MSSGSSAINELTGPGEWYPVPGFYFSVIVLGVVPSEDDCSFKEVSGIEVRMDTETIPEGGVNNHEWNVPKGVKYSNLILKRGVMPSASYLSMWVQMFMIEDITEPIDPKNIIVILNNENGMPLYGWWFANAYPVKWTIDPLDSMRNEYLVESIEFSYQFFVQGSVTYVTAAAAAAAASAAADDMAKYA